MRIDIGTPIKQGGYPHGEHRLGHGSRTIGQAGCLLCCMTMAARALTGRPALSVLEAHTMVDMHGGFAGSGLNIPRAARALWIEEVDRDTFDLDAVRASLDEGRPVIVGIDYRGGRSSGYSDADHFVLATAAVATMLSVADPAVGRLTALDLVAPRYAGNAARLTEAIFLAPLPA